MKRLEAYLTTEGLTPVGHTESMEYVGRVPAPPLDRFIDDIFCLTGCRAIAG